MTCNDHAVIIHDHYMSMVFSLSYFSVVISTYTSKMCVHIFANLYDLNTYMASFMIVLMVKKYDRFMIINC